MFGILLILFAYLGKGGGYANSKKPCFDLLVMERDDLEIVR